MISPCPKNIWKRNPQFTFSLQQQITQTQSLLRAACLAVGLGHRNLFVSQQSFCGTWVLSVWPCRTSHVREWQVIFYAMSTAPERGQMTMAALIRRCSGWWKMGHLEAQSWYFCAQTHELIGEPKKRCKALLGCCKGRSLQPTASLWNLGNDTKKMEEMEMGEQSADKWENRAKVACHSLKPVREDCHFLCFHNMP